MSEEIIENTFETEARIVAEIASRLCEWIDLASRARVISWVCRLNELAMNGGSPLELYLRHQCHDASLARSYAQQAEATGLRRQTVHKAFKDNVAVVARRLPVLAEVILSEHDKTVGLKRHLEEVDPHHGWAEGPEELSAFTRGRKAAPWVGKNLGVYGSSPN